MASHNPPPSSVVTSPTLAPPSRPTRPRLSRGISSRKPAPPPVPPSLRDHPLLDAVSHGSSSSSSAASSHASPASAAGSRQSSLSTSPHVRPTEKIPIPLPSPTSLWALPTRPSPPIAGPWSAPAPYNPEPVNDAMGLLDTVPAGSTVSVASPGGYPWHAIGTGPYPPGTGHVRTPHGYEHGTFPHATHSPRRHPPHPAHNPARSPGQRHNVGALHTHSPQPSPPVTPAAA